MGSSSSTTFLLFLYSFLLSLAAFTLSDVYFERNCSDANGNYTPNSAYQTNLNAIISQFPTLTNFNYGFFNLSAGESPNKVYSSALCRGDLTQDRCYSCLNYTATELERLCPWNKAAIAWSEICLNASNPVQFNQALNDLLNELSAKAASGGPLRKYAAGNASAGNL
ncbi:cysteine-rich repeat secretory protein 29-like [Gossypium arboreum]|uniref:cysteine-rich repeat secretory protein 29-like n=1 Tax=Gossypium arboreum TaxID=29729 RepID=UPI0022F1D4DC|nr:cysteine-rich repeat secretory protein 29-like [Gossypium arboreum]